MSERVFKYHGLGNDFVVLDRRQTGVDIGADEARALCDRRRGIGADGVLAVLPSTAAAAKMVVHNADGSVSEMCGNGVRCVARFIAPKDALRIAVETGAGVLTCTLDPSSSDVEVDMGAARLVDRNLPSGATGKPFVDQPIGGTELRGTAVSMGNPHLVLFGAPPTQAGLLGPRLELHFSFPDRTNVEFCAARPGGGFDVAVWERGVGLTQACGTGACAVGVAAVLEKRAAPDVWLPIHLPGGLLHVHVASDLSRVRMRGPVTFAFEAVVGSIG